MKYVAAYLLATIGGKAEPTKKDIENILASVGADADAEKTNALLTALKGKNIEEVIAEGRTKLASVPSGGAAPAAAAPAAGGAAPAAEAAPAKKEEKKEESEDEDMGFGLFD
uniref:Large ribosomal subunit protein P2 n=1 Tax=Panagrellus redivivus TaxID=6233 RepID=A0A7E4UY30_PANRE